MNEDENKQNTELMDENTNEIEVVEQTQPEVEAELMSSTDSAEDNQPVLSEDTNTTAEENNSTDEKSDSDQAEEDNSIDEQSDDDQAEDESDLLDPQANLSSILEAAIFYAAEPMNLHSLSKIFPKQHRPEKETIKQTLLEMQPYWQGHGVELVEVASGWRFQISAEYAPWLQRLNEKKPPRYSRAMLETLALIIYKQPITRAEIEEVRGVAVSTQMIKNLLDRDWIKVAGQREVPGRPSLFITTKRFLDDFNFKKLSDLPAIEKVINIDEAAEEIKQALQQELKLPVIEISVAEEEETTNIADNTVEDYLLEESSQQDTTQEENISDENYCDIENEDSQHQENNDAATIEVDFESLQAEENDDDIDNENITAATNTANEENVDNENIASDHEENVDNENIASDYEEDVDNENIASDHEENVESEAVTTNTEKNTII